MRDNAPPLSFLFPRKVVPSLENADGGHFMSIDRSALFSWPLAEVGEAYYKVQKSTPGEGRFCLFTKSIDIFAPCGGDVSPAGVRQRGAQSLSSLPFGKGWKPTLPCNLPVVRLFLIYWVYTTMSP